MKFPVALQLYSVRDSMQDDFEGTLKIVKEMGYDGVEFAGLFGHSYEEVRDLCKNIGLTPISAHVPFVEMLSDPEKVIGGYKTIGCEYVVIPYTSSEYYIGTDGFSKLIEGAKKLGAVAEEFGMQLCYHNHDFEFTNQLDGEYMLDAIYRLVPENLLKTQLDTCWVRVGGEDPSKFIEKYTGRCPTVHLKDYVGNKSETMYALIGIDDDSEKKAKEQCEFELRPVGYGVQDFPCILSASRKAGAKWVIVEQDRPSMNKTPLECAKVSIDYLKTINL